MGPRCPASRQQAHYDPPPPSQYYPPPGRKMATRDTSHSKPPGTSTLSSWTTLPAAPTGPLSFLYDRSTPALPGDEAQRRSNMPLPHPPPSTHPSRHHPQTEQSFLDDDDDGDLYDDDEEEDEERAVGSVYSEHSQPEESANWVQSAAQSASTQRLAHCRTLPEKGPCVCVCGAWLAHGMHNAGFFTPTRSSSRKIACTSRSENAHTYRRCVVHPLAARHCFEPLHHPLPV